jgi:hypothetical protein
MSTAQLTRQPPPETPMDEARDLVPVLGAVFQAGPPTYALVAFGAVITLLACSPLVILGAVLMISFAVTAILAAVVVLPVLMLRRVHGALAARRSAEARSAVSPRTRARPRWGRTSAGAAASLSSGPFLVQPANNAAGLLGRGRVGEVAVDQRVERDLDEQLTIELAEETERVPGPFGPAVGAAEEGDERLRVGGRSEQPDEEDRVLLVLP